MKRISSLVLLIPLRWAIPICNVAGSLAVLATKKSGWLHYQQIHARALTILLSTGGCVFLLLLWRHLRDYTRWRRGQARRGEAAALGTYLTHVGTALRRRRRRWHRPSWSSRLSSSINASSRFAGFINVFYLFDLSLEVYPFVLALFGWLILDRGSAVGLLLFQVVMTYWWIMSKEYTPKKYQVRNIVRSGRRFTLSFSPETYKANRLWQACWLSLATVFGLWMAEIYTMNKLQHNAAWNDVVACLLAMVGQPVVTGCLAFSRIKAYLRWRRGQVTMDDVSEEMEWVLVQRKDPSFLNRLARQNQQMGEGLALLYFEQRSNIARAPWSWALRKHSLLKNLKSRPLSYYLLGLAGLGFAEGLMVFTEWYFYGKGAMWLVVVAVLVANILGVIAWIIGDDDDFDFPHRPQPLPLPVPGLKAPIPKIRPRVPAVKSTVNPL